MGLTNGAANIMSIIAPLLVGFIVHDETDPVQWRYVFFISAGIYFFGNLMFVLFSKTDVQPWNDPERSGKKTLFKHKYDSSQYLTLICLCVYICVFFVAEPPIHNTHRRGSCNLEAQAGF